MNNHAYISCSPLPKHTNTYKQPRTPPPPSTYMPNCLLSKLVMQLASMRIKRRNVFIDESNKCINRYSPQCNKMDCRLVCPCRYKQTQPHAHRDKWFWRKALLLIFHFILKRYTVSLRHIQEQRKTHMNLICLKISNLFIMCDDSLLLVYLIKQTCHYGG